MASLPEHSERAERAREGWRIGADGRLYRKVSLTELDFEKLWDEAELRQRSERPEWSRMALKQPWPARFGGWCKRVLSKRNRTLDV